jgi:hypothetical protein
LNPQDAPDDPRGEDLPSFKAQSLEELTEVTISDDHPSRKVRIGSQLDQPTRDELVAFLRTNSHVFAWSYSDMPGISTDIISHKLTLYPSALPVRQKRRAFDEEKYRAIQIEVTKLQQIEFIREVHYPTWLSNVVMVRKPNGRWRMCIDYTHLNKACPKDSFPLPRIDQLVDSTAGHKLLSFMDAYSGYNQIKMDPLDQEHTSFTTDKGLYCYQVMPFGLKNAGATY